MARAKFGAVVTAMKGKIGGHVFSGNELNATVRTNKFGKGGVQFRNAIYQNLNSVLNEQYTALSENDKSNWVQFAVSNPIIGAFGDLEVLSGRNMYVRHYTAFLSSGQTGTIDPTVAVNDLPSSSLEHVQFNFSNQELDVQFEFDRFSTACIVYARPVPKFGLTIDPKKLPFLYGEADETPQDDLLWDAFFAKYPDFQEGSPCQFGIAQVNQYGFKSFIKVTYGSFV